MIRSTRDCDLDLDAERGATWDAVVVGAGPAGSLAARRLATSGARVLLVDKEAFPRDKVCGACLNGPALAALEAAGLGSLVPDLGGVALEELHLCLAGRRARLPLPAGAALSRSRLDAALVRAARDAGAHFLPGMRAVVGPTDADAGVRRVTLFHRDGVRESKASGRVVLVAAGLGQRCLGGEPFARTRVASRSRIGAGCALEAFPEVYREGTLFMAVGRGGYVGLVRVEDGRLNVAAAFDGDFLRSRGRPGRAAAEVLDEAGLPAIAALDGAAWRGTVGLTRRTRPIAGERIFLLGDATGYVEPFTGEGMGWALTSATAVAPLAMRGIARWDPSIPRDWSRLHRRLVGRRQRLCRGLALLLRHPRLGRAALALAERAPGLARGLIAHVNAPASLPRGGLS